MPVVEALKLVGLRIHTNIQGAKFHSGKSNLAFSSSCSLIHFRKMGGQIQTCRGKQTCLAIFRSIARVDKTATTRRAREQWFDADASASAMAARASRKGKACHCDTCVRLQYTQSLDQQPALPVSPR